MNEIVTKLLASTAAVALAAFGPAAFAQSPQGASVAAGSIAVTRQGATTVVTQGTERGIIDWRSFSIGAGEAVRFDQPGRSSVTLNRVTGSELSRIDGNLSATGQVWLANPNGVLIGPGGQVNVGGLLATTGRIDAGEFLRAGRAAIDQIGKDAAIVNRGTINILDGGYAALAAASIRNDGVIAARAGSVALGAGKAMTVDFTGDKLITFQVNEAMDQSVSSDSMISNGGTIAAAGGTVLMSARAAKGVMDNVVNLKGHVIANSVTVDGGTVSFGDGGVVQVSGKIDASNVMGKGGDVAVLGEKVGLMDGAVIDASGATGGGTVLVGGDWQGKGAAHNAQIADVAPTAMINVDATMAGDGGKAVVWADDTARFNGSISARGGVLAGDGGQVETSGKNTLSVTATARVTTAARAAGAKPGSWLLDPADVTISGGGFTVVAGTNVVNASTVDVNSIYAALDSGDVTIQTGSGGGVGDITVGVAISYGGTASNNTLTLDAVNDIKVDNAIGSSSLPMNVKLLAGRDILVNSAITTKGGSVTALANRQNAGGAIRVQANIETSGGSIVLAGGTDMTGGTAAVGRSGATHGVEITSSIVIDAGAGGVRINGIGFADNSGVEIAGTVKMSGAGTIEITGSTPTGTGTAVGVNINSGSTILSSGTGPIKITGDSLNSGASSHGVRLSGTVEQSSAPDTGAITIVGKRGTGGSSVNISFASSGDVKTTKGNLTLDGSYNGGDLGTSYNYGVYIGGGNLSTVDGAITVDGAGPGPTSVTGSSNYGIALDSATSISATGSGKILLKGIGSGALSTNHGIWNLNPLASGAIMTNTGDLVLQTNLAKLNNYTSAADAIKSTTGTIKLKSLNLSDDIGLGTNTGQAYFGGFVTSVISGKLEIGDPGQTGEIKVADGWTFNNDTTFVTDTGNITFVGKINGGKNVTAITAPTGIVSFADVVGGSAMLESFTRTGVGAKTVFGAKATAITTNANQSYSGPVELTEPTVTFTSSSGAITFNGPIDSASNAKASHSDLVVNAAAGLTFNNDFGFKTGYELKSFTNNATSATTFNGKNYVTDETQSFAGSILLKSDATISAGGAVTVSQTIDTAPATLAKALSITAPSATLTGSIGATSALSSFTLSVSNGALTELPGLTTKDLTLSTGTGAITQLAAMTVTGLAKISTTGGDVTLTKTSNNFKDLNVTVGSTGNASIRDGVGDLNVTGANVGGTLGLEVLSTGAITQTGAISASTLAFSNANVVKLDDANNKVGALTGSLAGADQSLTFAGSNPGGLTLNNLIGKSLNITQSGTGAITVAASNTVDGADLVNIYQSSGGAVNVNGIITTAGKADVYTQGGALSFASGSELTAGTASFGGASINGSSTVITVSNAPLVLFGSSGSITTSIISVNSNAANPVAAGFVTLLTQGGAIMLNSETVSGPPVSVAPPATPTTPTLVSTATVASVATIAPTVVSIATVASVATIASVPTLASVATVPTRSFVQSVIAVLNASGPGGVTTILNQVLPPPPNFNLVVIVPLPPEGGGQRPGAANSSAQALANIVTATPSGAFIPMGPLVVAGTGAPLASAPTIKVDAADTGGANGQVIAIAAPGGVSGERTVMPGILSEVRSPRANAARADPPLAQQPPTMNDEPFLD